MQEGVESGVDLALGLRQQPQEDQGFSPHVWGVTVTSLLMGQLKHHLSVSQHGQVKRWLTFDGSMT